MRRQRITTALGLLALPLAAAAPVAHAAEGWQLTKAALQGEAAPGTAESFEVLDLSRESGGAVLFVALLSGDTPSWALYRFAGGAPTPLALPGDPAPGAGGATWHVPLSFPSGSGGDHSFGSLLLGGSATRGLFADTGAGLAPVYLEGDAAPGGGSFAPATGDLTIHDRNAAGDVVFVSGLSGTTPVKGLFLAGGGGIARVHALGEAAPGGGTWSDLRLPSVGDGGSVTFVGSVSGGVAPTGLFLHASGTTSALAWVGDAAPGTGGGAFDAFHYPLLEPDGDVTFLAGVAGAGVTGGVFRATGTGIEPLILENDPIPGTGGGLITQFKSLPTRGSDGALAFGAGLDGGPLDGGVFLREEGGAIRPVALAGETAPDAGGASFASFDYVGLDAAGDVAFRAELSDGRSGLFSARATAGVPVPGAAVAALAALLGAAAVGALRRAARPARAA